MHKFIVLFGDLNDPYKIAKTITMYAVSIEDVWETFPDATRILKW